MPPGQEGNITLTVKTDHLRGTVDKTARVQSNDPTNPMMTLRIKGKVKQLVDFTPERLDLKTTVGKAAQDTVTIVNNDKSPMKILDIKANGEEFSHTVRTVEAGKRYEIDVKFKPQSIGGNYTGSLSVQTDSKQAPNLSIPLMAKVEARVEAFPTTLNFFRIQLDAENKDSQSMAPMDRWVTVRSQDQGFQITKVESSLPFITTEIMAPKQPGQAYRIKVGLIPGKMKKGLINGKLVVRTNDKEFSKLEIPMTGEIL